MQKVGEKMHAGKQDKNKWIWVLACVLVAVLALCTIALCACSEDENSFESGQEEIESEEFFVLFYFDKYGDPIVWSEGDTEPSTEKDGYYFVGWFEDNSTQRIDLDTLLTNTLTQNHSLYAKYVQMQEFEGVAFRDKTVVWDGEPHSIEVEGAPEGASVSYNASPERTSVGEYEIKATIEKAGFYTLELSATLTIQKRMQTVTFKQTGCEDEVRYVEYGTRLVLVPTPRKVDGYEVEWENVDLSCVVDDMVVNCQFTPLEYTICMHENISGYNADSVVDDVVEFSVESDAISLPTPTRDGYTFVAWYDNCQYLGEPLSEVPSGSVGNLVLYAKWDLVEYTVDYVDDGYIPDVKEEERSTFTIESGLLQLAEPTYTDGRQFVGWFDNPQLEGEAVTYIPAGTCESIVLYPKTQAQQSQ